MNLSLHDLKEAVYIFETGFGVLLLVAAVLLLRVVANSPDALFNLLIGGVLLLVACVCILFGLSTYFLRDEQDIWQ